MRKFLLLISNVFAICSSFSQWNGDPTTSDTKVCTSGYTKSDLLTVSDNSNGSIVLFNSYNAASKKTNVYAQRVDKDGYIRWGTASDPLPVQSVKEDIFLTDAIADGDGGVFISWEDHSKPDLRNVYVQHLNNKGEPQWKEGGTKISTADTADNYDGRLCADGLGGLIVVFIQELRDNEKDSTTYSQLFTQKINSTGILQWGVGTQVSTATGFRAFPALATDGAGGVIVFFADTRNSKYIGNVDDTDEYDNIDVFCQRISSSGSRLWGNEGKVICDKPGHQFFYTYNNENRAVSDGSGGAIIFFDDHRRAGNKGENDLYVQRVNGNGDRLWQADGVLVSSSLKRYKYVEKVISDGEGGAITLFDDWAASTSTSIITYAQRIGASGESQWLSNGLPINTDPQVNSYIYYNQCDLEADGKGNYLVTWTTKDTKISTFGSNIKAQKITPAGVFLWGLRGVDINTQAANAFWPSITSSQNGSAIITWMDDRNGPNGDIYTAKVVADGLLPVLLKDFTATSLQTGVALNWTTAVETNTKSFVIEKSKDGVNFTFEGEVNARGIASTAREYSFVDIHPIEGTSYYRLKILETTGSFTYSVVRKVVLNRIKDITVKVLGNPVTAEAKLMINALRSQPANFTLFDAAGKVMTKGNQQLVAGGQILDLKLNMLPAGTYYFVLYTGKGSIVTLLKK